MSEITQAMQKWIVEEEQARLASIDATISVLWQVVKELKKVRILDGTVLVTDPETVFLAVSAALSRSIGLIPVCASLIESTVEHVKVRMELGELKFEAAKELSLKNALLERLRDLESREASVLEQRGKWNALYSERTSLEEELGDCKIQKQNRENDIRELRESLKRRDDEIEELKSSKSKSSAITNLYEENKRLRADIEKLSAKLEVNAEYTERISRDLAALEKKEDGK